jgi:hypothetical protein
MVIQISQSLALVQFQAYSSDTGLVLEESGRESIMLQILLILEMGKENLGFNV